MRHLPGGSVELTATEAEAVRKVVADTTEEEMRDKGLNDAEIDLALSFYGELTVVTDASLEIHGPQVLEEAA